MTIQFNTSAQLAAATQYELSIIANVCKATLHDLNRDQKSINQRVRELATEYGIDPYKTAMYKQAEDNQMAFDNVRAYLKTLEAYQS